MSEVISALTVTWNKYESQKDKKNPSWEQLGNLGGRELALQHME